MRVRSYSLAELGELAKVWRNLERGPEMTAFQGFDWYRAVASFAKQERLSRWAVTHRVYVVFDETGEPVLLAPLRMHHVSLSPNHRRGLHFMGRNGSADYLNFVYRDFSEDAASLALAAARHDFRTDHLVFERVLGTTASCAWLDASGFSKNESSAVAVEVPQSADAYQAMLSKRARQNIRTAGNRARTDGLQVDISFGGRPSAEDAAQFAALKSQRAHQRERRDDVTLRARLIRLLKKRYLGLMFSPANEATEVMTSHPSGWYMTVRLGGEFAAFAYGLREDWRPTPELRVLQVAFQERFARYSPGVLGLHQFLAGLASDPGRPVGVVDFTRGEEPYKFALGGAPHTYATLTSSVPRSCRL